MADQAVRFAQDRKLQLSCAELDKGAQGWQYEVQIVFHDKKKEVKQ